MRKLLIIGLLFLSAVSFGQVGSWDSTQTIIYPTSTTLKIPLSATDTIYGFDVLPSDSGNNYVNRRSKVQLIYDFNQDATDDTIYAATLFPNYDYDSLFYTRISNKTINADSTLLLPQRITEFEVYSTATDRMSYFNVAAPPTSNFTVPGDYGTIQAAITAASSGDTIIIKSGYYTERITITSKGLKIYTVGDVVIDGFAGTVITLNSSQNEYINGFRVVNGGTYSVELKGGGNHTIDNMFIESVTNSLLSTLNDGSIYTFNNSYLFSSLFINNELVLNECILEPKTNSFVVRLAFTYDVTTTYSLSLDVSGSYLYRAFASFTLNSKYNDYESRLINTASLTTQDFTLTSYKDQYQRNQATDYISIENGFGNCIFRKSIFNDESQTTDIYFDIYAQKYLQLDSCIFDSTTYSNRIRNTDTAIISNNRFTALTNSDFFLEVLNSDAIISNNYLYSNKNAYLRVTSADSNSVVKVNYNEIISETGASPSTIPPLIILGTEDLDSYGLDGSMILGNKLRGGGSFGFDPSGKHGIIVGSVRNCNVSYNDVKGFSLGIVSKSEGFSANNQNISYNIIDSCTTGLTVRGNKDVRIHNNTSITSSSSIVLATHENDATTYTENTDLFNNILYSSTTNISSDSSQNLTGFESNNNIFIYSTNLADIKSTTYNLTTWQGLGYDANSYNTDPNFKSSTELWPITPSDAIGNGLNLGATYQNGLSIQSTWPDNVITTPQLSQWSIGAYVVPLGNRSVKSNQRIIYYNEKLIKFNN